MRIVLNAERCTLFWTGRRISDVCLVFDLRKYCPGKMKSKYADFLTAKDKANMRQRNSIVKMTQRVNVRIFFPFEIRVLH